MGLFGVLGVVFVLLLFIVVGGLIFIMVKFGGFKLRNDVKVINLDPQSTDGYATGRLRSCVRGAGGRFIVEYEVDDVDVEDGVVGSVLVKQVFDKVLDSSSIWSRRRSFIWLLPPNCGDLDSSVGFFSGVVEGLNADRVKVKVLGSKLDEIVHLVDLLKKYDVGGEATAEAFERITAAYRDALTTIANRGKESEEGSGGYARENI